MSGIQGRDGCAAAVRAASELHPKGHFQFLARIMVVVKGWRQTDTQWPASHVQSVLMYIQAIALTHKKGSSAAVMSFTCPVGLRSPADDHLIYLG